MTKIMDKSIIYNKIDKASSIALITHVNPDGDTLGAGLALYYFLKKLQKRVSIYCDATTGIDRLDFISGESVISNTPSNEIFDLVIAVDIAETYRMGSMSVMFDKALDTMCIDHHLSNPRFAKYNYVIPEASSTCEITFDILEYIESQYDKDITDTLIASHLYAGLLTDSGAFYYPSTTADTHRVAGELHKLGVNTNKIYTVLFKNVPFNKYLLKNLVMSKTRLYDDGRIGMAVITRQDFEDTYTDMSHTEGLINMIQDIDTVQISILITQAEGGYKISFRSVAELDVNAVAGMFGGGGHKNASGCRLSGNIYEIMDKLLYAARTAL